MIKRIDLSRIITVFFLGTVFVLFLYSLGFFTNLMQIRGSHREIYDIYQSYVRMVFNFSGAGIALIVVRKIILSQVNKRNTVFQFVLGVIIALIVIGISIYGLLRMGEFQTLYQDVKVDDVQLLYPKYEYNDSVFFIGYLINSLALIISIVFLIITGVKTSWKQKEAVVK